MLPGSPAIELAPPRSWFLLCHSIELALKAFLTLHGKSESELKLIGHDLKKLLDSAEKCGLKLTPYTYGEIEMLAKALSPLGTLPYRGKQARLRH